MSTQRRGWQQLMDRARREGRVPGRRRLLTDEQIAEARRRIVEDGESARSVARSFRCSDTTIRRACWGTTACGPPVSTLARAMKTESPSRDTIASRTPSTRL